MSRIAEKFQKLHRPVASMGFGFAAVSVEKRRMLLVVRVDQSLDDSQLKAALAAADAAIATPGITTCAALLKVADAGRAQMPVGVWTPPEAVLPAEATASECDFVVCDVDGPVDAASQKKRGCLMRIAPLMEPSRLRATAEIGTDAVVLDAESLDLTRLSSVIECRRVHTLTGKPIILHAGGALAAPQLSALWRAGVDGLMVDLSMGAEGILALRATIDSATFDSRPGAGGGAPVIGAHVGSVNSPDTGGDDGGEGDDDDDDDQ